LFPCGACEGQRIFVVIPASATGTPMPMTSTATTHFRLLEAQGVTPGGPVSLMRLYPDPPATA
jgi:hypothetical protein